ncbi:MAG TPA: imidazoleglycerol-phosphate dehydratase HisB [Aestuariivirgaceae bacterium]|nr:imidazoleglycerol-phosphate dehydratase HisB [Aestuariivirgaceae bacterium]
MRKADVKRETKETQISVSLDLDGSGQHDVASGIGFLDHMLEQLARHGQIDLELRAQGDLHIDMHHTAEDVGIVIGQAIARALGDRCGIRRFSSVHLAMDEALTRVVIDVSGRPYLVWKVALPSAKLDDFDTELVREWFHAFAQNAGITLHVETLYGDNTHHIVETCFKGLARALREAVAIDERAPDAVPSTKGMLAGKAT